MNKLKNVRVRVIESVQTNPYKRGSFKHAIFAECLKRRDGFTRSEFNEFLLQIKKENEVESRMKDEILCMAWWSEFANKAQVFEPVD